LLSTLEFFGLPRHYMEGNGHFPMWGKESAADKLAAQRKKQAAKNAKGKKPLTKAEQKAMKMRRERGLVEGVEEEQKPTHFDISVFLGCFKRLVRCDG